RLVTVVPRLTANAAEWGDATVELPQGTWHNLLTGEIVQGGAARLEEILARFPVALLNRH
ncbi:MAG: hypothetical protein R3272_14915, partial [Candidatus Promineifilaceae bacterium]|nr:hypothetical protein [Candidatus Promineifilaceae bacterium]